ncbi:MAG: NeuD/PglB/VioB family sugar acetyltransferase [Acidimicrobiia bacterium]|nr:NeuD/PglB/VioB family sugar acetyltransferase [Acidimicrobiia bacterium]
MALAILGAGGVGREALDVALALDLAVVAFADDALAGTRVRGLPVVAPADLAGVAGVDAFIVGIAGAAARQCVAERAAELGLRPAILIHPRAIVGPETSVADGCLLLGGAHVSSSVTLGAHVQVHYNATVGHDTRLGPFASVYPGANVSGSVEVGAGATIGSGAVVLQGLTVGAGAFVGAGAVVTRDVMEGDVVVGNPARAR